MINIQEVLREMHQSIAQSAGAVKYTDCFSAER